MAADPLLHQSGNGAEYTVQLIIRAEHVSGAEPSWDQVARRLQRLCHQFPAQGFVVSEPHGKKRRGQVVIRLAELDEADA